MGFRISYIIAPVSPKKLVQPLGFQLGVETDALPYDEWWVGTLKSNGLTVFWSEAEGFVKDVAGDLAALSQNGDVYACSVNETNMHARAVCYAKGHEKWRIEWRGDHGPNSENLVASGSLPEGFAASLEKRTEAQSGDTKKDHFFEIPLDMVSASTGFRHDYDMTNKAFSRFFRITEATDAPANPARKGLLAKLLGR